MTTSASGEAAITSAVALGHRGMVVAGHPLAAQEGWRVLENGGSTVDAAIAAAIVLTVVLPQACSIGGDMFALVHNSDDGRVVGLNGSGRAPFDVEPEQFAGSIPERGALSVVVPGAIAGMQALHERYGRIPWSDLFETAVDLASNGVTVSDGLARAIVANAATLDGDPGCRQLFLPATTPLPAGALFRQQALAETLRTIAVGGARAFYGGEIAATMADFMKSAGGLMSVDDLANCRAEWVSPLATAYRHAVVHALPPNSFGLYLLMQLNALSGFDLGLCEPNSAERFALLMAAADVSFEEGAEFVADPDAVTESIEAALAPNMAARLQRRMRDRVNGATRPSESGGTALVAVADQAGNGIVLIESIFLPFGAAVLEPATGIVLNNRMRGFTIEAGRPNTIGPGKRPAHTLSPAMVTIDDRLRFLLGTPGGPGQTLTLAQVISLLIDHEFGLDEAVRAPRWSMDLDARAIVEVGVAETVRGDLAKMGRPLQQAEPGALFFGSVEAIEFLADGRLRGVADHRRDAGAIGV